MQSANTLCAECWLDLSFIGKHKCKICGLGFEFDMGKSAVCGNCAHDRPKYNKAVAVAEYIGTARRLAIKLKFGDGLHLAPYMAGLMVGSGAELLQKTDIIAPIPLHYRRRILRRYNQAGLLAVNIAKLAGKPYQPLLLNRTRATKQQTKLHKRDRVQNVADAFKVRGDVSGKRVLLVDDVMTTGATISACAAALKAAGAKRVYSLVFARVGNEKI